MPGPSQGFLCLPVDGLDSGRWLQLAMTRAPLTHAVPPATITAGRTATARRRRRQPGGFGVRRRDRRQCQAARMAGQSGSAPRRAEGRDAIIRGGKADDLHGSCP